MALDPSDLLEPPFTFGESSLTETYAEGSCSAFANENFSVFVTARKRGDWVHVNIPNILEEAKTYSDIDFATIRIEPFLSTEFLGENTRKRIFGGLARVFEMNTGVLKTVPAMITMEKDGAIIVNPAIKLVEKKSDGEYTTSSNWFYSIKGNSGKIGSLNINFTYVIDDGHEFNDDIKLTKLNGNMDSI